MKLTSHLYSSDKENGISFLPTWVEDMEIGLWNDGISVLGFSWKVSIIGILIGNFIFYIYVLCNALHIMLGFEMCLPHLL